MSSWFSIVLILVVVALYHVYTMSEKRPKFVISKKRHLKLKQDENYQPLKTIDFKQIQLVIPATATIEHETWKVYNPSIAFTGPATAVMAFRFSNMNYCPNAKSGWSSPIMSKLAFARLEFPSLKLQSFTISNLEASPLKRCNFAFGYEDPRIIAHNNELWMLTTARNHRCIFQQYLHKVSHTNLTIESTVLLKHPSPITTHDKNWNMFSQDGRLFVVTDLNPHRVYEITDTENGTMTTILTQKHSLFNAWNDVRGTAGYVLLNGYYIGIGHTVRYSPDHRRTYVHFFYAFDSQTFQIVACSKLFCMSTGEGTHCSPIQMVTGISYDESKQVVAISFGVMDCESYLVLLRPDEILSQLIFFVKKQHQSLNETIEQKPQGLALAFPNLIQQPSTLSKQSIGCVICIHDPSEIARAFDLYQKVQLQGLAIEIWCWNKTDFQTDLEQQLLQQMNNVRQVCVEIPFFSKMLKGHKTGLTLAAACLSSFQVAVVIQPDYSLHNQSIVKLLDLSTFRSLRYIFLRSPIHFDISALDEHEKSEYWNIGNPPLTSSKMSLENVNHIDLSFFIIDRSIHWSFLARCLQHMCLWRQLQYIVPQWEETSGSGILLQSWYGWKQKDALQTIFIRH